ncbi:hypothetical protein C0J27_00990 [Candidatus Chromulinivorax destructor]|uniref:Uncharacterized protein n=1 Tax=Candidatus Chromulinivorax destructor TaxID=2066483 RepID=A0A345ZAK9_9BACT|nr:hypothetical protein C0J27_00990 [Candidatus Chromulinivorax destructor]
MNQIFTLKNLPYVFYENSGNLQASGPDALSFKLKKRNVAAATTVSGDERSDIVGLYATFKFGSHSQGYNST